MLRIKEKKLANKIKNLLNKRGFIVEIRASKKSKSVYIKLDNGACSGIRISDHKKKNNSNSDYLFSVVKNYKGPRCEFANGKIIRYYDYNSIGRLIYDIESERGNKIINNGYSSYKNIREKRLFKNINYYYKNVA